MWQPAVFEKKKEPQIFLFTSVLLDVSVLTHAFLFPSEADSLERYDSKVANLKRLQL